MKTLIVLALLLIAVPVSAQTTPPTVPTNAVLTVSATHEGVGTDGYRIYIDNVKVGDQPRSSLINGVITVAVAGPSQPGPHTLQFSAYNVAGEDKSQAMPFNALGIPLSPGNVTITDWKITISSGPTGAVK